MRADPAQRRNELTPDDAFVQEIGFRWIMVEDEYGRDPAIAVPRKTVLLRPLTMISKRIEKGEVEELE